MIKQISIILAAFIIFLSCDWPFNTETTGDEMFKLTVEHNIDRVLLPGKVYLNWTEITVENFVLYRIEKIRPKDSTWTLVDELTDPFQLSYVDTIRDDDDLTYRVGIVDVDDFVKWAEKEILIPKTTSVIVPIEFKKIQDAVESELLDDGDEIIVKEGEYVEKMALHYKDILITSESGFLNTIIRADSSYAFSTINMSSGVINGFTIKEAFASQGSGGGVFLTGNGIIRNCLIIGNYTSYVGGGLYVGHNGSIYNSIIYNNYSNRGGNGIFINSGDGEIINNTFIDNDIVFTGDCKEIVFRNNIFHNVNPAIIPYNDMDNYNFTVDYSLFNYDIEVGTNNIIGDPEIVDYYEFKLSNSSLCIDAGHPDEKYNDVNGTRNDIGSYGGPSLQN